MKNMFKIFNKENQLAAELAEAQKRIKALEDYHDITLFEGGHNKTHYRKRFKKAKKRGRPTGSKNKVCSI